MEKLGPNENTHSYLDKYTRHQETTVERKMAEFMGNLSVRERNKFFKEMMEIDVEYKDDPEGKKQAVMLRAMAYGFILSGRTEGIIPAEYSNNDPLQHRFEEIADALKLKDHEKGQAGPES